MNAAQYFHLFDLPRQGNEQPLASQQPVGLHPRVGLEYLALRDAALEAFCFKGGVVGGEDSAQKFA